jgi:AcrR family transcriptional regulator
MPALQSGHPVLQMGRMEDIAPAGPVIGAPEQRSEHKRGRGRPTEVDPEAVARVALSLFVERGFEETSLDDIAVAAGVSRRTLLRIFSSKRELVWGGAAEAIDRIRDGLAAAPADEEPIESVRRVYVASLAFPPELVEITRQRLRLIASSAELRAWGMARTDGAREIIAEFLAQRTGQQPGDLGPRMAGHVMSAAANAALFWWAETEGGDPSMAVDDALRQLERGLAS